MEFCEFRELGGQVATLRRLFLGLVSTCPTSP